MRRVHWDSMFLIHFHNFSQTLESAYEAIQTAPDRSSLVGGSTATLVHIDSASRVLEGIVCYCFRSSVLS